MSSRHSRFFAAIAIPAGFLTLLVTAALAWRGAAAVVASAIDLILTVLLATLACNLSFSTSRSQRVSLELGFFIAAALVLPFPGPILAGAAIALVRSPLRMSGGLPRTRVLAVTGANVTVATIMTAAGSATARGLSPAVAPIADPSLRLLLLAAALFLVMNAVNFLLMSMWALARGEGARARVRYMLTLVLPWEMVTIPFGSLLAYMLAPPASHLGFVLLALIGLFASFLLKTLSDSDDRLRAINEELEERVDELAMLNAIGREVSSSLDPARVFRIVRRECRKVFRPDFFSIARIDHENREVHAEHSLAGEAPLRQTRFPLGQGLTSEVVTTERPFLVADALRDPRMKTIRPIVIEPKIRSILAVPMIVENRVVGVLSVQAFRENAYQEKLVPLLSTIGQQAAVALENARHYQLATVDNLTGLYQRDYFFQRLGDEQRRAARYGATFSLLMLDLDAFKKINDRFGHFAGDRFLKAVGSTMKAALRAADIPCRYGGEEFCVLLPETDLAGARIIAERIRRDIGGIRVPEGAHALSTTVSIGIASYPVHYEGSLSGLLQKADQALYTAKKQGKDRVISAAA